MAKQSEIMSERNEPIWNDRSVPLSEVMRIASEAGVDKMRPNKLPDWMTRMKATAEQSAEPVKVEIVTDRARGIFKEGILTRTADSDREAKITGWDVVWRDFDQNKKETRYVRIPLSRMRGDEIKLKGKDETYQPSPKGGNRPGVVKVDAAPTGLSKSEADLLG